MSTERALLRGAVIPTVVIGVFAIGLSTWFQGVAGFVGALLAQFIVIAFFAANLLAARVSRDLDPMATMGIAMFSYVAKVVILGVFLWLITSFVPESACNRAAFGISAVGATFAWLGGEISAYLKLKLHLELPPR